MTKGFWACLLAVVMAGPLGAETLTRTATVTSESPAAVFAVPNGYAFTGATASEGAVTLGEATTMNGVVLQPVAAQWGSDIPVASNRTIFATFESGAAYWTGTPSRIIRNRIKAWVANPDDVPLTKYTAPTIRRLMMTALPTADSNSGVDMLIISPPSMTNQWEAYAELRMTQLVERVTADEDKLTIKVVDTFDIYNAYPYPDWAAAHNVATNEYCRNAAESIHKYLRENALAMGVSYIHLGGTWIDAQSLNEAGQWVYGGSVVTIQADVDGNTEALSISNAVPGVIVTPREALASDAFYACLDIKDGQKYPWSYYDEATQTQEERYFYVQNNDLTRAPYYDAGPDLIVSRMTFKPFTINGTFYGVQDIFDAYTNKLVRSETNFKGTGFYGLFYHSQNYVTYNADGSMPYDYEFFDDTPNLFADYRENKNYFANEKSCRPQMRDHIAKYRPIRGVDVINAKAWTSGYATMEAARDAAYAKDRDYQGALAHGWRGGNEGNQWNDAFLGATGLVLLNDDSLPCDTGMLNDGANLCLGESAVEGPTGGAIASINNTHYGWSGGDNDLSLLMWHMMERGFLQYNYNVGNSWLDAHLNFIGLTTTNGTFYASNLGGTGFWVFLEHSIFGDPLPRAQIPHNVPTVPGDADSSASFPAFASNVLCSATCTVTGTNAVLTAGATGDLTLKPATDAPVARFKVMNSLLSGGSTITFADGLEGGVGRLVGFTNATPGKVVIETNKRLYLGGFTNVAEIVVKGSNAILDVDTLDSALTNIVFEVADGATNTIRGIKTGQLAHTTIHSTGGVIKLETADIFGGTSVVLEGSIVTLGPNPAQGSLVASSEPLNAVFSGSGKIEYPYGTKLLRNYTIADGSSVVDTAVGSLQVGFRVNGTLGSSPNGWFTSWSGETFNSNYGYLSPGGFVGAVSSGHHPWYALPAKRGFTVGFYADLSMMTNTGNRVMLNFGSANGSGNSIILLCGENKTIDLVVTKAYGISRANTDFTPFTYPGDGFHLYIIEFQGNQVSLQIDGDSEHKRTSTLDAITLDAGLQIGAQYAGRKNSWVIATDMLFGAMVGYDAILTADETAAMVANYPVQTMPWGVSSTLEYGTASGTGVMRDADFAPGAYLGISKGTIEVPAGTTVNVPAISMNNTSDGGCDAYLNIRGEAHLCNAYDGTDLYYLQKRSINNGETNKLVGVMMGHWAGSSTINVYSGGYLNVTNSYILCGYDASGNQLLDIAGGHVQTRGVINYSCNAYGGSHSAGTHGRVMVREGGVLEVSSWPVKSLAELGTFPITFSNGTLKAYADWTCPRPLTFADGEETGALTNTIDCAGEDIVFSGEIAGMGTLKLMDSSADHTGSITFLCAHTNFTGTIVYDSTLGTFGCRADATEEAYYAQFFSTSNKPAKLRVVMTTAQVTSGAYTSSFTVGDGTTIVFVDESGYEYQSGTSNVYDINTWSHKDIVKDGITYTATYRGTDGQWDTLANWCQLMSNSNGSSERYSALYTDGLAPMKTGGRYVPTLIDGGYTVYVDQLEGWNTQLGIYGGAKVTVDNWVKFQNGTTIPYAFIHVGEESQLTINSNLAGNHSDNISLIVDAPSGIVFTAAISTTPGNAFKYALGEKGSVVFGKGVTVGSHNITNCTIRLSEATNYKRIVRRELIDFGGVGSTNTFNVTGLTILNNDGSANASGTKYDNEYLALKSDTVGNYVIEKNYEGLYIACVDYATDDTLSKHVLITGDYTGNILTNLVSGWTATISAARGYCAQAGNITVPITFEDGLYGVPAFYINNGYSDDWKRAQFDTVNGTGTITGSTGTTQTYVFKGGDFSGSLLLGSVGSKILFAANGTSSATNQITVATGTTANLKDGGNWTAKNGIRIDGTLSAKGSATIVDNTTGIVGAGNITTAAGYTKHLITNTAGTTTNQVWVVNASEPLEAAKIDALTTSQTLRVNGSLVVTGAVTTASKLTAVAAIAGDATTTYYGTFEDALAAARDDKVIVLRSAASYTPTEGISFKVQKGSNELTLNSTGYIVATSESDGVTSYSIDKEGTQHNITYHVDGKVVTLDPATYLERSLPLTLPVTNETKKVFEGWYESSECTGDLITAIPLNSTADVTYYAVLNEAVAQVNGVYYDTYESAIDAGKSSGYSVNILKEGTYPDEYMNVDGKLIHATAQVGTTLYSSFGAATNTTDTIKLLANVSSAFTLKPTQTLNIQLNGHTVEILVEAGCKLTTTESGDTDTVTTYTSSIITYDITYNTRGGTLPEDATTSYTVQTATFELPTPTRTDCAFLGWYNGDDFSAYSEAVTQIEQGSTGSRTLYAKWALDCAADTTVTREIGNSTFENIEAIQGTGTLKLTGSSTLTLSSPTNSLLANFPGTIVLDGGTLVIGAGSSTGLKAGDEVRLGSKLVVNAGATLNYHLWTSYAADFATDNKVKFMTPIELAGTLYLRDGGNYIDSLTASGTTGALTYRWQKGLVIGTLNGDAGTALTINTPSDTDDNTGTSTSLGINGGTFNGRLTVNNGIDEPLYLHVNGPTFTSGKIQLSRDSTAAVLPTLKLLNAASTTALNLVLGSNQAATDPIVVDTDLDTSANFDGTVTFETAEGDALTCTKTMVTTDNVRQISITHGTIIEKRESFSDYTIPSGYTLQITGSNDAANPVTATNLYVPNGTTNIISSGYVSASFVRISGTRGMQGHLIVAKGATLTITNSDAIDYSYDTTGTDFTLDVYGTLDFGTTRQTLRNNLTFNIYEGATVTGFGDDNDEYPCALQCWTGDFTFHFLTSDADDSNAATFAATLGLQNNAIFDIASDLTVHLTGNSTRGPVNKSASGKYIYKTGGGTLSLDHTSATALVTTDAMANIVSGVANYRVTSAASSVDGYTAYSLTLAAARIGDDLYATVQNAINATTDVSQIVIVDSTAEIPSGYTTVTKDSTVTLRRVGGEVYWKGTSDNSWPTKVTVWADSNTNSTTTYDYADTMVIHADGTRFYPDTNLDPVKIKVLANKTLYIGHTTNGSNYNLPTNSTITVESGAQVLFSYWNNNSKQGAAKVGEVTIYGSGTFGYDLVNSDPMTMGKVTGTATLVITNSETVTVASIENPISLSGTGALKIPASATQPTDITIPDQYVLQVAEANGTNTYTCLPLVTLTIDVPANAHIASVTTNDVAVTKTGDQYKVYGGANVTVTFEADSGHFLNTTQTTLNSVSFENNTVDTSSLVVSNIITMPDGNSYQYVFRGGAADHVADWNQNGNWYTSTGTTYRAIGGSNIPGITGTIWHNLLFDGDRFDSSIAADEDGYKKVTSSSTVNGYNIGYGLYHHAHITINMLKNQSDGYTNKIVIDDTSKLIISGWDSSNGNTGTLAVYIAAEDGIELAPRNMADTYNLYLSGSGSIALTAAATAGSYVIKAADATLSAANDDYRTVTSKKLATLVSGTTVSFTTGDDAVTLKDSAGTALASTIALTRMPTVTDAIGTYAIIQEDEGVYLYYVDYATTGTKIDYWGGTDGSWSGENTWTNAAGTAKSFAEGDIAIVKDGTSTLASGSTATAQSVSVQGGTAKILGNLTATESIYISDSGTLQWGSGQGNSNTLTTPKITVDGSSAQFKVNHGASGMSTSTDLELSNGGQLYSDDGVNDLNNLIAFKNLNVIGSAAGQLFYNWGGAYSFETLIGSANLKVTGSTSESCYTVIKSIQDFNGEIVKGGNNDTLYIKNIATASGVTTKISENLKAIDSDVTKSGDGTLKMCGDVTMPDAALNIQGGSVLIGRDVSSGDWQSFASANMKSIEVGAGSTLDIRYVKGYLGEVTLNGDPSSGKALTWFDQLSGHADNPIAISNLTVNSDSTIAVTWKGTMNVTNLEGTGSLTVTHAKSDTFNLNITTLSDYSGTYARSDTDGSTTLGGATLAAGKTATIAAPITLTDGFAKTGKGTLVLSNSSITTNGTVKLNGGKIKAVADLSGMTSDTGTIVTSTETISETSYNVYALQHTVTVPAVDHATLTVVTNDVTVGTAAGDYTVDEGATVVVTYTAETGYVPASTVITLDDVTANTTVSAPAINVETVTLAINVPTGTTIDSVKTNGVAVVADSEGHYKVEPGVNVTVTFAAKSGYSLTTTEVTLEGVSTTRYTVDTTSIVADAVQVFSYVPRKASATVTNSIGTWFDSLDNLSGPYVLGPDGVTLIPTISSTPYQSLTAKDSYSVAVYADVGDMTTDTRRVIVDFGDNGNGYQMLVRNTDGTIEAAAKTGTGSAKTTTTSFKGWHLFVMTYDDVSSNLCLYVDGVLAGTKTEVEKSKNGFQLGSMFNGNPDTIKAGEGCAIYGIYGYDAALRADEVTALSATYPAVEKVKIISNFDLNDSSATVRIHDAVATTNYVGATNGHIIIPINSTVETPHLRILNNWVTTDSVTLDIAGTMTVTSDSTEPNVWGVRESMKGVLLGHWHGTGTYNITGTLNATNVYIETVYTAEAQAFNVNGGTVRARGFYAANGNSTITLSNNGTLEVWDALVTNTSAAVTQNYGYGTIKFMGDHKSYEITKAMTFTDSERGTTLDANGNTNTVSASTIGGTGKVIFTDSSAAKDGRWIIKSLDGCEAEVTFGDVDVTVETFGTFAGTLNLEKAERVSVQTAVVNTGTINLNGGTLIMPAGYEGVVNVASGATLKLLASADQIANGYTAVGVNILTGGTVEFWDEGLANKQNSDGNRLISSKTFTGPDCFWAPGFLTTTAVNFATNTTLVALTNNYDISGLCAGASVNSKIPLMALITEDTNVVNSATSLTLQFRVKHDQYAKVVRVILSEVEDADGITNVQIKVGKTAYHDCTNDGQDINYPFKDSDFTGNAVTTWNGGGYGVTDVVAVRKDKSGYHVGYDGVAYATLEAAHEVAGTSRIVLFNAASVSVAKGDIYNISRRSFAVAATTDEENAEVFEGYYGADGFRTTYFLRTAGETGIYCYSLNPRVYKRNYLKADGTNGLIEDDPISGETVIFDANNYQDNVTEIEYAESAMLEYPLQIASGTTLRFAANYTNNYAITGSGTLQIAEGKSLTRNGGSSVASTLTLKGPGSLIIASGSPSDNLETVLSRSDWNGTLVLPEYTAKTYLKLASWGNANSVIEVNTTTNCYLNGGNSPTINAKVVIAGDVIVNDGSSNQSIVFREVTGDHSLSLVWGASGKSLPVTIQMLADYTGVLAAVSTMTTTVTTVQLSAQPAEGAALLRFDATTNSVAATTFKIGEVTVAATRGTDGYYLTKTDVTAGDAVVGYSETVSVVITNGVDSTTAITVPSTITETSQVKVMLLGNDVTSYFTPTLNGTTLKLALNDSAKPTPTAMTGTDGVQIKIGSPVPGLFYSVLTSTSQDFSGATEGTVLQATSTDDHTVSATLPAGNAKVLYFRVQVKATK